MHLHKALLEEERAAYEQVHGRVAGTGELLHLVINHEQFAWLHPVSRLIAAMDEALAARAPAEEAAGVALLRQAGQLLKPSEEGHGFARKYYDALQRDPDILLAHAALRKLVA